MTSFLTLSDGLKQKINYTTSSPEETIELGVKLGRDLPPSTVLCFCGDLAAGKTTFIKGIVSGAAHIHPNEVQSPTFSYLNIYMGEKNVYHFDLYRLHGVEDFLSMGFDDYFDAGGICCIEWTERIQPIIPSTAIWITLAHAGEGKRTITIEHGKDDVC